MCYSNCPYENYNGGCMGINKMSLAKPHCHTKEEWEAYNETVEDDKVLDYELTRQEGTDN
jgi:hypothetical protein